MIADYALFLGLVTRGGSCLVICSSDFLPKIVLWTKLSIASSICSNSLLFGLQLRCAAAFPASITEDITHASVSPMTPSCFNFSTFSPSGNRGEFVTVQQFDQKSSVNRWTKE